MVLLQNESVKWACRGFLPHRSPKAPPCARIPAGPCQPCGLASRVASGTPSPHILFCEALALPSSWGCCGALRRWQVEKCLKGATTTGHECLWRAPWSTGQPKAIRPGASEPGSSLKGGGRADGQGRPGESTQPERWPGGSGPGALSHHPSRVGKAAYWGRRPCLGNRRERGARLRDSIGEKPVVR